MYSQVCFVRRKRARLNGTILPILDVTYLLGASLSFSMVRQSCSLNEGGYVLPTLWNHAQACSHTHTALP
jgi:hypothetical protein